MDSETDKGGCKKSLVPKPFKSLHEAVGEALEGGIKLGCEAGGSGSCRTKVLLQLCLGFLLYKEGLYRVYCLGLWVQGLADRFYFVPRRRCRLA